MLAVGMTEGIVYHGRNGLFIARPVPTHIHQTITPKVIKKRRVTELLGRSWRDIAVERAPASGGGYTTIFPEESSDKITECQKDKWGVYAKGFGTAYKQEKRFLYPHRLGIIRRGGVVMDGWNAFVQSNSYVENCDWKIPRFEPPPGGKRPTAPIITRVWLEGERLWIAIEEPSFDPLDEERAIRVWGAIQLCDLTYYFNTIGVINIQGAGMSRQARKAPKRYHLFSVDKFRLSRWLFGVEEAVLADLDGAKIMLQCDAVSARSEKYGAVVSPVGNLVDTRLPRRRKEEGISKKIKDHIRAYRRGLRAKNRDRLNAQRRKRYHDDHKYRAKILAYSKHYWHKKYKEDETFRRKEIERAKKYKRKKKQKLEL